MKKTYYVYILCSMNNTTLYIGVTNNLERRVYQHKTKENKYSFTYKYNIVKLVYFEEFRFIEDAILREKRMKKWNRAWKDELIAKDNPLKIDLALDWFPELKDNNLDSRFLGNDI